MQLALMFTFIFIYCLCCEFDIPLVTNIVIYYTALGLIFGLILSIGLATTPFIHLVDLFILIILNELTAN